jgi:hypothetical protein
MRHDGRARHIVKEPAPRLRPRSGAGNCACAGHRVAPFHTVAAFPSHPRQLRNRQCRFGHGFARTGNSCIDPKAVSTANVKTDGINKLRQPEASNLLQCDYPSQAVHASQIENCDRLQRPLSSNRLIVRSKFIAAINRRVFIKRRPQGMPVINDFGIESVAVGDVASGFVVIKVDTLSIDAWIRTTLSDAGMHETAAIGETIPALGVGQIVESNSSDLVAGD